MSWCVEIQVTHFSPTPSPPSISWCVCLCLCRYWSSSGKHYCAWTGLSLPIFCWWVISRADFLDFETLWCFVGLSVVDSLVTCCISKKSVKNIYLVCFAHHFSAQCSPSWKWLRKLKKNVGCFCSSRSSWSNGQMNRALLFYSEQNGWTDFPAACRLKPCVHAWGLMVPLLCLALQREMVT